MAHKFSLSSLDLAKIDSQLEATDGLLKENYPGDDGSRQPVHTVYVPADRFTQTMAADWGAQALAAADARGGLARLGVVLGQDPDLAQQVVSRVEAKLAIEPIEDLRLDFEDGFGDRGDAAEDSAAAAAASTVAAAAAAGTAPPFIGIRFKCFEAATRNRGLRTLDLFVATLAAAGELPEGLVLTLPKVTTVAQVQAMDYTVARLEEIHSLPPGSLRFEVQVETPQLILGPDGTSPVAQLPHVVPGRISGLHYGTYDYLLPCRFPPNTSPWNIPCRFRQGSHATGRRRHRHTPLRRFHQHHPGGRKRRKRLGEPWPAGPPLAGARLLPGLGPAPRPAAQPLRCHVRLLPSRPARRRAPAAKLSPGR